MALAIMYKMGLEMMGATVFRISGKLSRMAGVGKSLCHSTYSKCVELLDWHKIAMLAPIKVRWREPDRSEIDPG